MSKPNSVDTLRAAREGRPIYRLSQQHITRSGTVYAKNVLVWVHGYSLDGSLAKVSKINNASLPSNTTFTIPTSKLEKY